jgi:hypothetical protein
MAQPVSAPLILEAFDVAAARGAFPAFDNLNVDYISSRLTAYRSDFDWAIVFNSIAWMGQDIVTIVEPIGNCVEYSRTSEIARKAWAENEEMRRRRETMESTQGQSFLQGLISAFKSTRDMGEWMQTKGRELLEESERARQGAMASGVTEDHKFISPAEIEIGYDDDSTVKILSVSVRGRSIPVPTLTIEPRMDLHRDVEFWAAVALVERHRDALLAQPAEVARFFPRGLPPEFLALDDWHHVDVSAGDAPSRSATFQALANAIAAGDPSAYKPTDPPNTHWSNWLPK